MMNNGKQQKHDYLLKFILIGDSTVGKSQLVRVFDKQCPSPQLTGTQYSNDPTRRRSSQTSQNIYLEKELLRNNKKTILRIMDTGGQERYRSLTASYYRGAHGCLILFDVTQPHTFDNVQIWFRDLQEYSTQEIESILVGTKMNSENRKIAKERAEHLAASLDIPYMEVSSKDGTNVSEVFEKLADMVLEKYTRNPNLINVKTSISSIHSKKGRSWCSC